MLKFGTYTIIICFANPICFGYYGLYV